MKRHLRFTLLCIGVAVLLYIIIWVWFSLTGEIPVGQGLQKSDWLQFFGSFLGFLGTTFLGVLTIWQSNEIEKKNAIINFKANVSPNTNGNAIFTYNNFTVIDFKHHYEDSSNLTFLREKKAQKGSEAYLQLPFIYSGSIPDSIMVKSLVTTWYLGGPQSCEFIPEKFKYVSVMSSGANTFDLPLYIGQDASKYDYFSYIKNLHEGLEIEIELQFKISNVVTNSKCALWVEKKGVEYKVTTGNTVIISTYMS